MNKEDYRSLVSVLDYAELQKVAKIMKVLHGKEPDFPFTDARKHGTYWMREDFIDYLNLLDDEKHPVVSEAIRASFLAIVTTLHIDVIVK